MICETLDESRFVVGAWAERIELTLSKKFSPQDLRGFLHTVLSQNSLNLARAIIEAIQLDIDVGVQELALQADDVLFEDSPLGELLRFLRAVYCAGCIDPEVCRLFPYD